jgi:hypothetical protein
MEGPSVKGDEVRRERGDWEGVCPSSRSQSSKRLDVGGMETQLPELVVDGWGFTKIWEIVASQRKGVRQGRFDEEARLARDCQNILAFKDLTIILEGVGTNRVHHDCASD